MSLWSKIDEFFAPRPARKEGAAAAAAAAADIPLYLKGLITRPERAADLMKRVEDFEKMPKEKQAEEMIPLYLELEEYIIKNEPVKKHTKESLRREVREKTHLDTGTLPFKGIFLEKNEGTLIVFRYVFSDPLRILDKILGSDALKQLVFSAVEETVLDGAKMNKATLDFSLVINRMQNAEPAADDIKSALLKLAGVLVARLQEVRGKEAFEKLHNEFETVQKNYYFYAESLEIIEDVLATISADMTLEDSEKPAITVTPETKKMLADFGLGQLIEKGHVENVNVTFKTKEGGSFPVSLVGSTLKDKVGNITGMVIAGRDLTELKKYAEERLNAITPVLQKIAMGDFTQKFEIPESDDEFTEHLVSLNLMVDDLRVFQEKQVDAEQAKIVAETRLQREKAEAAEKNAAELQKMVNKIKTSEQQLKAANQQLGSANQQLSASEKHLKNKLLELERFNKVAVGRELKMVELKEEIARLKADKKAAVEDADHGESESKKEADRENDSEAAKRRADAKAELIHSIEKSGS
jgi:hypothetical protein